MLRGALLVCFVSGLLAGQYAVAGDLGGPSGTESASATAPLDVAVAAPAEEATGNDDQMSLSLARLAQLEQELGNGGAEHTSAVTAGWDKKRGFFIRDEDDHFLLRLGGRVQVRHTYNARDERGDSGSRDSDSSYFELERVRLAFRGHILDPRLIYQIQVDGDTDRGGSVTTLDAYARYEIFEDILKLGAGQWKAHFLRQEKTSSGRLQMVDRSLATEYFNVDRGVGAWIEGDLIGDLLFYAVSVTNGFRSSNRGAASDQRPAVLAKIDLNILGDYGYSESDIATSEDPNWVVGISGATDRNEGDGTIVAPDYRVHTAGVDTGFKWLGFSLQAEYMMRWLDYQPTATATDPDIVAGRSIFSHGFYAQGGYMVWPETIEITARISTVYGNEGANDGAATEVGPGINWFINGHRLKLQTDVMYYDISANAPRPTTNLERSGPDAPPSPSFTALGLREGEEGILWRTQLQLVF